MKPFAILALATAAASPLSSQQSVASPDRAIGVRTAVQKLCDSTDPDRGRWTVVWSSATRTPRAMYGPGLRVSGRLDSVADARDVAARLLLDHADALGIGASQLQLANASKVHRTYVLVYDQRFGGLRVIDGRADLRVNENGVVALLGAELFPIDVGLETKPTLKAGEASRLALDVRGAAAWSTAERAELCIWACRKIEDCKPALAWSVHVTTGTSHGEVFVDAHTGVILEYRSHDYSFVSGPRPHSGRADCARPPRSALRAVAARSAPVAAMSVSGTVMAWRSGGFGPGGPVVNEPVGGVRVQVSGGGSTFTDANGSFSIPHGGTAPVQVSVDLSSGEYLGSLQSSQGATIAANVSLSPGTPGTIQLASSTANEFELAQTTAFVLVDKASRYVRQSHMLGNNPTVDTINSLLVQVNDNQIQCNAGFRPGQLIFAASGSSGGMSCPNFAFPTVVEHEWGHALDNAFGGIGDSDLGEGWADLITNFCTEQPLIGEDFNGPGQHVRDANNTAQYPNGPAHQGGLVWMGGCWKLRAALIGAMGPIAGKRHAETIVIGSLVANASTIPDAVREVYIADDDDGNLNNGTPHCAELFQSFTTTHNIPSPVQTCSANPGLVTSFGTGCAGSGLLPATCASLNEANVGSGLGPNAPPGFVLAYAVTAPAQPLMIDTVELFTQSGSGTLAVHRSSGAGPNANAAVTATLNAGPTADWYAAALPAPFTIAAGETVYLVHGSASFSTALLTGGTQAATQTLADPGFGQWLPLPVMGVPDMPAWRVSCVGRGQTGAVPELSSMDLVEIGNNFTLDLAAMAPNSMVALAFGGSNAVLPGGVLLPADLGPLGAPSCALRIAPFASVSLPISALGDASYSSLIPNNPASVGTVIYAQGFVSDPAANGLGLVVTNGLSLMIGTP